MVKVICTFATKLLLNNFILIIPVNAHHVIEYIYLLPDLCYMFWCVLHNPQGNIRITCSKLSLIIRLLHRLCYRTWNRSYVSYCALLVCYCSITAKFSVNLSIFRVIDVKCSLSEYIYIYIYIYMYIF
jgi:hypothetical protein